MEPGREFYGSKWSIHVAHSARRSSRTQSAPSYLELTLRDGFAQKMPSERVPLLACPDKPAVVPKKAAVRHYLGKVVRDTSSWQYLSLLRLPASSRSWKTAP